MNMICTSYNIWWNLGLLGLQLKHLAPHHQSLHVALIALSNPQCSWSKCPYYSTQYSQAIGLLLAPLVVVKKIKLDPLGKSLLI